MKRIISLLISLLLLVQPIASFAFEDEVVPDSNDLEFAKSIGLVDVEKTDKDQVTRLDMANIITNVVLGDIPDRENYIECGFSDVVEDSYSVKFVKDIGVMNGVGNGKFAPNSPITYGQAVKVLVSLFGYDDYAMDFGGYPNGYLIVANNLKLTVPGATADMPLTFDKLSTLLKLGMNVEVKQNVSAGSNSTIYETDKNYLKLYKNIEHSEGVVTGINSTDLYSTATINFNNVNVDDAKYILTESSIGLKDYLGYNVAVYYAKESNGDCKVLYYELLDNKVVEIESSEIESFENGKLTYYENGTKKISAKMSGDMAVVYNGTFCATYNESTINPFADSYLDGDITIIDNNGDGKYDVVVVDAYDTFVVSQIVNNKVYNQYRPEVVLDFNDLSYENIEFTNILGQPIALDIIETGDILTVSRDKSGNIKRVVLTVDTYIDTVKSLQYDHNGNIKKIVFDEVEFECTRSLSLSPEVRELRPGSEIKCYFNKDMKISDIEAGMYNRYSKGYLVDAKKSEGLDEIYRVQIFTGKGEFFVAELNNQIRFNEDSTKSPEDIMELFGTVDSGRVKRQPILYQLDDEGKIVKICLADLDNVNDILYMYPGFDGVQARPAYRPSTTSFEAKLLIGSDTLIFAVPEEENRDVLDRYSLVTTSYFREGSTTPLFEAYGTEARSPLATMLVLQSSEETIYHAQQFCVVGDITEVLDEYGDGVYEINGIINGSAKTVKVKSENMNHEIEKGDIITYLRTSEEDAVSLEIVYDVSEDDFRRDTNPSAASYFAGYRFSYGRVVYGDGKCFTVEITNTDGSIVYESYMTSHFGITEYNSRENRIPTVKTATSDIIYDAERHPGDESFVFIFTHGGDGRYIVVYNK